MTAKKNRLPVSRAAATNEIVALHIEATKRLADLRADARELRDAGKIREARKLLEQVDEIKRNIEALEANSRPVNPYSD